MSQHAAHHKSSHSLPVSIDRLSTYDNTSIGREFTASAPSIAQAREHEARRSELVVSAWKESLSMTDSQRIPKSNLKRTCQFQTKYAQSHSIVTWAVYAVSACVAGVVITILIRHLNF